MLICSSCGATGLASDRHHVAAISGGLGVQTMMHNCGTWQQFNTLIGCPFCGIVAGHSMRCELRECQPYEGVDRMSLIPTNELAKLREENARLKKDLELVSKAKFVVARKTWAHV